MLTYLKRLLFDETAFVGAIRALFMVAGLAFIDGRPMPTSVGEVLSLLAMGVAMFMRSSSGPMSGQGPEGGRT